MTHVQVAEFRNNRDVWSAVQIILNWPLILMPRPALESRTIDQNQNTTVAARTSIVGVGIGILT
jgi:hypothetical protein